MEPSEVFARRIREVREARGTSQEDLAARLTEVGLPMDRATIARIEARRRRVLLDEVFAFAFALDVAPIHLFIPLKPDVPVSVAPKVTVNADEAREWVRARAVLPGTDRRRFFDEIPLGEMAPHVLYERVDGGEERQLVEAGGHSDVQLAASPNWRAVERERWPAEYRGVPGLFVRPQGERDRRAAREE